MSAAPLRVGLIGLGQMGRNHLRVLSILKGVHIGFVSDASGDAGRAAAQQYGVPFSDDPEAALGDVDAAIICTPTVTHDDFVRAAASKVRNIFVEKPLTDTLESSERLRDFAREKGVNVQVGFIERFNPAVQQLDMLLKESERVVSLDFARTNKLSARITDVDVIVDLMIHDVDLALHLNGPVAKVTAQGVVDDGMIVFASANLVHRNGRFSRIQASRITDRKIRMIQATCGDMFVNCDLLRKEISISRQAEFHYKEGVPVMISSVEETVAVRPGEALLAELQAFVASCSGGDWSGAPGVDAAVDAMAVCNAIQDEVRASGAL